MSEGATTLPLLNCLAIKEVGMEVTRCGGGRGWQGI